MQDAQVRTWLREPQVAGETLESLRELNHRFLDLVVGHAGDWNVPGHGLAVALSVQVAPLSVAQKSAAANCPYALFDLRFHDGDHWRMRLRAAAPASVADQAPADARTIEFVRLALFFAWHLASTRRLAAQLLLGMHETTVAAFRASTVDCLPALAASAAGHLAARWSECAAYWRALTAAAQTNPVELRRIQLYGLQLAAAARLGLRGVPFGV